MKKKAIAVLLAAIFISAAGCVGGPGRENPAPTLLPTERPAETPTESPTESPVQTPVETPAETPESDPPKQQLAPQNAQPTPEPGFNPATFSTRMQYHELIADDGSREELATLPSDDGYTIEVDLTNCIVTVFAPDGSTALQALCTVGKKSTPTPAGTFKMGKQRERFGLFSRYDCYAQYWSQIEGEIFFHSVLYDEPKESTLIRGTYTNLGKATSHGCVRLTVPDAKWIYENVGVGSTVIIHKRKPDKALRRSLKLPKPK